MTDDEYLTPAAVQAAVTAAFPGMPAGVSLAEAERRMRAGLNAAIPHILRAYWDDKDPRRDDR